MSAGNDCCQLQLNPDITGIGVRVALYVQILLGWVTSLIWRDQFAKNSRTAYMTALALLIASFIELTTKTLSLLDGLVVSFITTMMITFAIASYSAIPETEEDTTQNEDGKGKSVDDQKSASRWLMQACFVVFWAAWCFNMWRDPATFGLKDEAAGCDTNYNITIQLFSEVHATDPDVRKAALALVAIGFVIAFFSLFLTLETFVQPFRWVIGKFGKESQAQRGPFTKYEDDPTLQAIHVFFQLIAIGTFVFLIYATERTITRNDVTGETTDWTYGQTIALILLLQQIMDLFSTHIEKREKEQERRERADREAAARGDYPMSPFGLPTPDKQPSDPEGVNPPVLPGNAPMASAPTVPAPAAQT